jgi:hypothetical protein
LSFEIQIDVYSWLEQAIPDSLNPKDWILGIGRMFTVCMHMHRHGGFKEWRNARAEANAAKGPKKHIFGGGMSSLLNAGSDGALRSREQDSEYRGGYIPVTDSVPLVDRPYKAYAM